MAQMSVFVAFVSFRKKISSWGEQKSTTFQTPSLTKGKYLDGPHWSLRKGRVSTYFIDSYLKSFWLIGGWEPALLSNWTRFLCSLQNPRTSRNLQSSLCSFSADVMLLRTFLLWILGGVCFPEACSAPCSPAEVLRAHCQPRSNLPSEANGRLWSQGPLSARTSTSTASNFPDIRRDPAELPCPIHTH